MADLIFAYGSLMSQKVLVGLIGREADYLPDILYGYKKSEVSIEGKSYFAIVPSAKGSVKGLVFAATNSELNILDDYEGDSYKRKKIALASGKIAWAYVKA